MDEQRLHDKLDKIIEDVSEMKVVQGKQQVTLDHHVYRCDLLEESNELLKQSSELAITELKKEIEPIKKAYFASLGALKILGILLTVAGIVIGILKINH